MVLSISILCILCARACMRACMLACVHACVRACVCVYYCKDVNTPVETEHLFKLRWMFELSIEAQFTFCY